MIYTDVKERERKKGCVRTAGFCSWHSQEARRKKSLKNLSLAKCRVRLSKRIWWYWWFTGRERDKCALIETSIFIAVSIDKTQFERCWPRPSSVLVCPTSYSAHLSESGRQCYHYQKKEKPAKNSNRKMWSAIIRKQLIFFFWLFPKMWELCCLHKKINETQICIMLAETTCS